MLGHWPWAWKKRPSIENRSIRHFQRCSSRAPEFSVSTHVRWLTAPVTAAPGELTPSPDFSRHEHRHTHTQTKVSNFNYYKMHRRTEGKEMFSLGPYNSENT